MSDVEKLVEQEDILEEILPEMSAPGQPIPEDVEEASPEDEAEIVSPREDIKEAIQPSEIEPEGGIETIPMQQVCPNCTQPGKVKLMTSIECTEAEAFANPKLDKETIRTWAICRACNTIILVS